MAGAPTQPRDDGAVPQQPERHLHRRHRARRPGRAAVRHRRRGRPTTTTTAASTSTSPRSAATGSVPQPRRARSSPTSPTSAGVGDPGFSTSAAWLDYDRDGRLDLFVANYVEWSIEKDLFCTLDGKSKSYCTPESYKGQSATLYRNRGNGTFENVTARAGLNDPASKALGVALIDYNSDGWLDLFVANDTQPNRLYENKRNGTFADVAVSAGVAFNEAGVARAGMGVDAADYDGSGRQSLVIGNFSNEMMALYTNEGNGLFIDEAPTSTIGRASLLKLTFAAFFFDYDLDGRLDIFAANGHVADDISTVQPRVTYAQPPHLFRNLGARRFEEVAAKSGKALLAADGRARRRLRRLRRRRRSRPARHHQQRPGTPAAQRRRRTQPAPAPAAPSARPRTATPSARSPA